MPRPVPTAAWVVAVLAACYLLPRTPTSLATSLRALQPVSFHRGGSTAGGAAAREWWRAGAMRLRGGGAPGDGHRRGAGEGRGGDGFGEAVESLAMFDQEARSFEDAERKRQKAQIAALERKATGAKP
ncbi:hypothetical protein T484DRAFT_1807977 [Baffinella frigidus]|nr:hypothetical protein T484DRAFT_1807977 [Cryptophyta sp. CCMP2293]